MGSFLKLIDSYVLPKKSRTAELPVIHAGFAKMSKEDDINQTKLQCELASGYPRLEAWRWHRTPATQRAAQACTVHIQAG